MVRPPAFRKSGSPRRGCGRSQYALLRGQVLLPGGKQLSVPYDPVNPQR